METSKTDFETQFQAAVEQIKADQKAIAEQPSQPPASKSDDDSWQIEMMHWGAHY